MGNVTTPDLVRQKLGSRGRIVQDELTDPRIVAAAVLAVVLLPALTLVVVAWLLARAIQGVRRQVSPESYRGGPER
ncbi:MAG: hypothetical protein PPP58_09090 [Natronomonas sp.]